MIRTATPDDLEAITRMGTTFAKHGWKHVLLQNKRQVRAYARFLLTSPTSVILVEDRAGELLGLVAVQVDRHPMSAQAIATEQIYWVEPQARKGRTAVALFAAAKRWSIANGATVLHMGAPNEKVCNFYGKLGGSPIETLYQFTLEAA